MPKDHELEAHRQWLGFIQPVGLVVSPVALTGAQAQLDRNIVTDHVRLRDFLHDVSPGEDSAADRVPDLPSFLTRVLGWEPADLAGAPGGPDLPSSLDVALPEFAETLSPTYAVQGENGQGWMMLVKVEASGTDLDRDVMLHDRAWKATPQVRFERLLRENKISIGLLANEERLRLVYAPAGESSGHLTFVWKELAQTAGRPLFAALKLLLSPDRLWTLPTARRLPAILEASRKSQNLVSNALSEQVLDGLHELVRGFQSADALAKGGLLGDLPDSDPEHVYGGLLTCILRLVFLLYAEDRGLMPTSEIYTRFYSVNGLFESLRDDAGRHPGMLDLRYGAWARLSTLFRLVFDGSAHPVLRVPRRHGKLFDPDAYPFLEGRPLNSRYTKGERLDPPRVSDGVCYRVLSGLMMLDGERLSYRSLDVEQIGSVYESLMGFRLERTRGVSLAVKPDHVVVDLTTVLETSGTTRLKMLKEHAACEVSGAAADAVRSAGSVEELELALARRRSARTPRALAPGSLYLQPTEERRRSGSHYTPRSLTEPIVKTTLDPVLARLGERPSADQILDLKICDPAMGSGAFLVAACRYLGAKLVTAWQVHRSMPEIPPDEDPELHAQRLIAQRSLYGVDRNPFAVDLAKLSLWLTTLAREHPFTFLDHALKCGDSLVGLDSEQIFRLDWRRDSQVTVTAALVMGAAAEAGGLRAFLQRMGDSADDENKAQLFADAEKSANRLRLVGDAVVSAFFARSKPKEREHLLGELQPLIVTALQTRTIPSRLAEAVNALHCGARPVKPFHWHIEFPEVFREAPEGFDAVVGNPPFMGGGRVTGTFGDHYLQWLQIVHAEAHGNSDIVAHFFRRSFSIIRQGGTLGLIATNTISQGDTRNSGLRWICNHGGAIYHATRRLKWPGRAAVIISVVHALKHGSVLKATLDGAEVERITAYLFHSGTNDDPVSLSENAGRSFTGSKVSGRGFLFCDHDSKANSIAEMKSLIEACYSNNQRIFPFMGGEEINEDPAQATQRFIINFEELVESDARRWPDLMRIVEAKVKPERLLGRLSNQPWWIFERPRRELYIALGGKSRVLVNSLVSKHLCFVFVHSRCIFSHNVGVYLMESWSSFATLQSRVHGLWAGFFGSSLEDRPNYRPEDCFVTFPFPNVERSPAAIEDAGQSYHTFRASLMIDLNAGLTTTYNRFHDPDERDPGILRLRVLHDTMDRAVLDSYGWTDLAPTCQFLLEYEDEEDEETDRASKRKRPWRYRWPDEFRDEVLARLLDLNQERAKQERRSGAAAEAKARSKPASRRSPAKSRRKK
jgi:hypothetical protein